MNHTFPQQYDKVVFVTRKQITFSENMEKLRKPFLRDEKYAYAQNLIANKETFKLKDDKTQDNLNTLENGTKQDVKQNVSEADYANTTDMREETENSFGIRNDIKIDFKRNFKHSVMCSTVEGIKNDDNSISELETFPVSEYFTDNFGNKTNYFLESDTSIENLSFSHPLKPLKNSTFIIQAETNKKRNETFICKGKCKDSEIRKIDTNTNSKIFDKMESETTVPSAYEENKKLNAKIIQMELSKQIETKDKAMLELFELAQSTEFPKLKHLCRSECEKDNEGICKKIKLLKNDAKSKETHYGTLKYIWSTIKYPFFPVAPTTWVKVEGTVTKAYKQPQNKQENSINLEDRKYKTNEMEIKPYRITDFVWESQKKVLSKSKPRKIFHILQNGENNFKVNHKKGKKTVSSLDDKLEKIKRIKNKISEEALKKFR